MQISCFSVFVRRLINAATFCNGALGLKLCLHESDFGFALFEGQANSFALAETDDLTIITLLSFSSFALATPALFATTGEITSITGTNRVFLGHLTLLV
ncbi:hypothetical protein N8214_13985 [Pseudomonadales bacterium]|nr:hypothetical protein [Pseudomonadales bacterium]